MPVGAVTLLPVSGLPEIAKGDDLAGLIAGAVTLADGDVVVVSSKVVSKALGLWADSPDRDAVVARETLRVVAERRAGDRVTRIVESLAGPVLAAAGVDASNTGGREGLLMLPADADREAERLRRGLRAATALSLLGVVVSDTAGRPWRVGQTDFALGAAGVAVVDDLRGGVDADGRTLDVTTRALADELAAAADLVKGKADAVPVAVVRGGGWARPGRGTGAGELVRTGPTDWFSYGTVEAVRASLGVEPGSADAEAVGIPAAGEETPAARVGRAVAVALQGLDAVGADVGSTDVQLSADNAYLQGRAAARLQAGLWAEGLAVELPDVVTGLELRLAVKDLRA